MLFAFGALPLVLLLPLAVWKLPESPRWLLARGQEQRAVELARPHRHRPAGRPEPDTGRVGFAALASRPLRLADRAARH